MKESKFLFRLSFTAAFVFCVFASLCQTTAPLLAGDVDAVSSLASSTAVSKEFRMACYSKGLCSQDSDCCSGYCVKNGRNHCCVCNDSRAARQKSCRH